ncbi:hypothetical protein DL546_005660 [Coniochaeta pulveracea]|uniref:Myb-like domain-containing protein n=1 Tax=Coniochaeta pulveracea TaxID=177199 RepID=A0A420YD39_9PEZI|nr:hypothetical protein DL546_005660 [Coniochaeta pulveracea]
MVSEESSRDHEDGNDEAIPDAAADVLMDQETQNVGTEDEYGFLYDDSQIPPPQVRSSDEDSFRPSEPDEDMIEGQQLPLIKPESEAKRRAGGLGPDGRPFKRAKGAFNRGYLDLLNVDIEDAAAQYVPHDEPELPPSQVGLTYWSSVEKEIFFTALSRLGVDNVPGIARRIRTKGELEVRQYLKLLQDATLARKRAYELEPLYPEDIPAAVEIGAQCNAALEEAADALASRQERHEESIEEMRWDDDWLITPFNYKDVEKHAPSNMPSLGLFRVSSWLELSERLFMNANYPENNWQYVSDENPSIRTTALEDFHSLAVSITKRLVAAAIYVSESRIRAKQDLDPKWKPKERVRRKDVKAALLSLGMNTDNKEFWTGCARRLRVDVLNDSDDHDDNEDAYDQTPADMDRDDDDVKLMTYDEVEAALGGTEKSINVTIKNQDEDDLLSVSDTSSLDEITDLDDDQPGEAEGAMQAEQPEEIIFDPNEEDVQNEAKELLLHTAMPYPVTTRTRQAVESRVRNELQHVAYADVLDAKLSQREEKRLWNMLGRDAPEDVDKVKVPERGPKRAMHTIDEMYISRADWREKLDYMAEWAQKLPKE